MAKNYRLLQAKMSPGGRARAEAKADQLIAEMALNELRTARDETQERLAKVLHVKQSAISKLERRTDMYVSTLQKVIKALGGSLEIRAIFPEGSVRLNQFSKLPRSSSARSVVELKNP